MLHITEIKPTYNHLLVTGDTFEKDMIQGGVIVAKKGDLKLWQKVIAIGPAVRDVEVGDMVMIDPKNFAVKKYSKDSVQNDLDNNPIITYNFPFETVDDEKGDPHEYLYITTEDIRFAFKGYEKDEALIVPGKKMLIV